MSSPNKQPMPKPSGTDSVSKKQSFQEWAMAGGGVPLQYKGREHVWDRKAKQYAEGGEVGKGGAAFGVFPQMKPRRSKQDREAAKNVPVDLARGFVSGVLGAPGDIESFARLPYELITGKNSPTFLPTSEDIEKRLPFRSDTPVSRAASGAGQLAGGFYLGPGSPLKAVGALPGAIKHGAQEFAKASAAAAPRLTVYHGSPHKFSSTAKNPLGKFDASKMGTGEGAQAYGHGHYLAESPDVAKGYRPRSPKFEEKLIGLYNKAQSSSNYPMMEVLEDAMLHQTPGEIIKKFTSADDGYTGQHAKAAQDFAKWYSKNEPEVGGLYTVDLPDEKIAKMLNWDRPLSEQHPDVQRLANELAAKPGDPHNLQRFFSPKNPHGGPLGLEIYEAMVLDGQAKARDLIRNGQYVHDTSKYGQSAASETLRQAGIPGIRYLDQDSRAAGRDTSNFVVFPGEEDALTILDRKKAGGPVKMAAGGAIKEALKKLLNPKAAGGEVRMDSGGAAFGQYTTGRKYQAAKKRAENSDVNALPDPRTYAAVSGLLGEAPDELGFSVMHPDYAGIQKAGEKGFIGGTVLGMAPAVAPMTKGLPIGASIKSTYRPHTPLKPDPEVGSRFKVTDQGGLVPRKDLDIESLEGSQAKIFPWDATSRNKLVTEVSEVPLTKPVLTEGGDDYMRDIQHVQNRIAGASNEGIAKRIMTRVNEAAAENNLFGTGTGRVFGFPIRMGEGAEMAATFPTDIALDLIKQGGLKKKEIKALDENMRNMAFEGKKGIFKNMAPFGSDEFIHQLRNGLAADKKNDISGFSAMNMRKAFMDRIGLVENQKRLGFNLPDLSGSVLAPELKGIPKGYVGNVAAELDVAGKLSKSKSSTYDTDIPGVYAGSMPNMPIEILMPKTFENLYRDMRVQYPGATPEALRNMAVGAMEKRNKGISETIGPRNIDAVKTYQEGLANGEFDPNNLKQVYDFMLRKKLQLKMASGGEVKPTSGLSTVNKLCGCHD